MPNKDEGYTLIEMLVALTLLLILLFMTTQVLGFFTVNKQSDVYLDAVLLARNQMEKVLLLHDYNNLEKELKGKLVLKQNIEQKDRLLLISIGIYNKKSRRLLYQLQSYAENENDKK